MAILVNLISIWLMTQLFFYGPAGPTIIGFLDTVRIDRMVFVGIIIWFIILIFYRKISFPKLSSIEWFMLLFLTISSISFIISGANNDSSEGKNKWLNAIINISYYPFATYFIIRSISYSKKYVQYLLIALCIIGLYLMITSFMEHYQIVKFIWPKDIINPEKGTHFGRSRGPFLDAVAMGRVLTVGFACLVLMVTQTKGLVKYCLSLASILTVPAIYFTQTRGPWIGFGLVLFLILITKTTMRKMAVIIALLIIVAAIVGTTKEFSVSNGTLFSERQNTVVDREISYLTTIKMIIDHPLIGIGFGMFNKEWVHYFHSSKNIDFGGFDGSHNTFLTMLCELGLLGFAVYLIMFYLLISKCYHTYKNLGNTEFFEKNICLIAMALAGMYLVTGTVSDLRWSLMANNLVYMFFGLVGSISNSQNNELSDVIYLEESNDE